MIPSLRVAVVLRVEEPRCQVTAGGSVSWARYAPQFPSPHVERVSPGHLVALATAPDNGEVVLWRWYDAVVLGDEPDGSVRLWEPAHGQVLASARAQYRPQPPGSRAYASAGLPGAEWWWSRPCPQTPRTPHRLAEVAALYTENDLWDVALDSAR